MMSYTIMDYVYFRQDLDVFKCPYQELDYLVFSALAYLPLEGIVDMSNQTICLERVANLYKQRRKLLKNHDASWELMSQTEELLELCAKSRRYRQIEIGCYQNILDTSLVQQFSAMTFFLENGVRFIAFRGTDDTLLGWHEDFLMLCENTVSSQMQAVQYVEEVASHSFKVPVKHCLGHTWYEKIKNHMHAPLILGGHSKGGNLAMYASSFCHDQVAKRIMQVYNYDGPGFLEDVVKDERYQQRVSKMISYVPHYSFFGISLFHEEQYHVIKSSNQYMMQHAIFSWEVTTNSFIEDSLSEEAFQFSLRFSTFMNELSYEEKMTLIKTMFGIFDKLHLETFTDLNRLSLKQMLGAVVEIHQLSSPVKKNIATVIQMMWDESRKLK